jgi:hypothetical protein
MRTQDAAVELSKNMALASFPIIRLCGLFQLPSVPCPVYLFSCTELIGKPMRRDFPAGPRKVKAVWAATDKRVRARALATPCSAALAA